MSAFRPLNGVESLENRVLLSVTRFTWLNRISRLPAGPTTQAPPEPAPPAVVTAFPGAVGFGAESMGGRGGEVYHVTNLDNSGAGSLRHGIQTAEGPTTIVFDVSGTINLASRLYINKPFITIAGQTAPGDGITIRNYGTWVFETNDVVIRHIRFRPGDAVASEHDSLVIYRSEDVVIDHVSASWSVDEVVDSFGSTDVTIQWSIISEALADSHHSKGTHSAGMLHDTGGLTLYKNLFADNQLRNPLARQQADIVNNVIYNWGDQATLVGWGGTPPDPLGPTQINLQANYYIAGPSTRDVLRVYRGFAGSELWESNNLVDPNRNGVRDGVIVTEFSGDSTIVAQRFDFPAVPTDDAITAYQQVLSGAGASHVRDAVDQRIVDQVLQETGGIINSPSEVGGYPILESTTPPVDSDGDGMPDDWENLRYYLDPTNPGDRNGDFNRDGVTNLEDYLNHLAAQMSTQEDTASDTNVDPPIPDPADASPDNGANDSGGASQNPDPPDPGTNPPADTGGEQESNNPSTGDPTDNTSPDPNPPSDTVPDDGSNESDQGQSGDGGNASPTSTSTTASALRQSITSFRTSFLRRF